MYPKSSNKYGKIHESLMRDKSFQDAKGDTQS